MRIAFLTDIHLNATAEGWQQQPRWCEGIPRVLDAVRQRLEEQRVDLLIFGGDLVDEATPAAIEQAARAFSRLPTPAIVCMGNHDLTESESLANWQRAMEHWPQARLADAHLALPDLDVFALNNAWRADGGEPSFRWDRQNPISDLLPHQLAQLDTWLSANVSRPAILAIHAPLHPLPPELTGEAEPSHKQPDAYTESLLALLQRHPRVRLVLAGHCHVACATNHQPNSTRVHLVATSLTEVPYQFPLIELASDEMKITTQTLAPLTGGPALDAAKQWVTGRASDRQFTVGRA